MIHEMVLQHVQDLFDSLDDWTSASPIEVELHRRLATLAERLGDPDRAAKHQAILTKLAQIYSPMLDAREMVYSFFSFKNITGIKLNYARELAALLQEDDPSLDPDLVPASPEIPPTTDREADGEHFVTIHTDKTV